MVELPTALDTIFRSFADSTRRDILKRVCKSDLTITEIARPYGMSFAAIAKHVAVLEKGASSPSADGEGAGHQREPGDDDAGCSSLARLRASLEATI